MDTLPLPPHPNLEQYKKRAKDLVAAAHATDDGAVSGWARAWLDSLVRVMETPVTPFVKGSMERAFAGIEQRVREKRQPATANVAFALFDAHFLIAEAHGFKSWAAFVRHIEQLTGAGRGGDAFELAADTVVTGDLSTLETLLKRQPDLIRARSTRVHRATLLHYISANGVEDFRQRTPPNATAIATFLLQSGAEVDALAETYDGGWWQTTMNLLVSSAHPAGAGVQPALVDVLADFGAALDGVRNDESPVMTALDFGYIDAAETLVRRGARIDNVVTAAALGRLDLVQRFVVGAKTLRSNVPLVGPPWRRLPDQPAAHIELALVWACKFARDDVAEFLLDAGVSPSATDGYQMTPLHWAAGNGCVALMRRLIASGATLETKNTWGGTVLDSTVHFAIHQPVKGVDYAAVLEMLIAAGADVMAAFPSGDAAIDELLRRYGARG